MAELKYKPWGEVRVGSAPTSYTYTGQYSNVSDFGLLFYNARWYDPNLGRMAQADSIVPGGVQSWDRYAYANNSPLVFTDPSGHFGKRNDEKSDYWNRRNQQKVKDLEVKWQREQDAEALSLLQSQWRQNWKEIALDISLGFQDGVPSGGKRSYARMPNLSVISQDGVNCPKCVITGALFFLAIGVVEIAIGAGMVLAAPEPFAPVLEPVLLLVEVAALDLQLMAISYAVQGFDKPEDQIQIDPFIIVPTEEHLFNPRNW